MEESSFEELLLELFSLKLKILGFQFNELQASNIFHISSSLSNFHFERSVNDNSLFANFKNIFHTFNFTNIPF